VALVSINGRKRFFDTDKFEMRKVSNGRWEIEYDRGTFLVVGGIESGGARHEWFCYYPLFYGENWLPVNSMVEAIRKGVVY
jgi:hypothetical protein